MKYKTVFDTEFGKEDRRTLDGGVLDNVSEDSKMILRRYNTEIFEPRPEDLPAATPQEIRELVAHAMRLSHAKKIKFYPLFLKIAAVFVLIGALFVVYSVRENSKNMELLRSSYADAKTAVRNRDTVGLLDCVLNIQKMESKGMRLEKVPSGDTLLRCTAVLAASQKNTGALRRIENELPDVRITHLQMAMVTRGRNVDNAAVFPQLNKNTSEAVAILSAYPNIPEETVNTFSAQIDSALRDLNPLLLCRTAIQLKQYESGNIKDEYRAITLLQKSFDMAFALNDLTALEKMLILYKQSSLYRQHDYNALLSEFDYLKKHASESVLSSEQINEIRIWLQQEGDK